MARGSPKNRHGFNALGRMGDGKTNFPIKKCNTNCAFAIIDAATHYKVVIPSRSVQPRYHFGSTEMPFGEEAMKNHCAYCHGKLGLVRHRRAFKSFCSQKCVDHYRTWLRAEVRKRKSWSDCLWLASLNVV